ncbi:hypothetical protein DAPPUDRAFT_252876 [Daphnia pulex]|uniref:Uncharacterized protein n=1 Tax=Daphnia pulex TaxID=6669 RepID=E9H3P1_DAPPU|nr:hypothetical protein DAPPUDRAFT_252876 [Daphnia pulex]|eukprot:EFX73542.1 hypothetical protein DAPPUDRAFT_252876 [Daphnia pulex]
MIEVTVLHKACKIERNTMDRSSTLTVQTNQDHKTEKSVQQSSVKPSPDAADSNKEVIELHQAEIETLEKSSAEQWQLLAELKNRLRASRAVNLSLRQQRLQQSQQLQQQLLKCGGFLEPKQVQHTSHPKGLSGAIALAFDYLVGFTFGDNKLHPCKTDTFNKYTLRMSYEALRYAPVVDVQYAKDLGGAKLVLISSFDVVMAILAPKTGPGNSAGADYHLRPDRRTSESSFLLFGQSKPIPFKKFNIGGASKDGRTNIFLTPPYLARCFVAVVCLKTRLMVEMDGMPAKVVNRRGLYDVTLYRVVHDRSLRQETIFECVLSIPATHGSSRVLEASSRREPFDVRFHHPLSSHSSYITYRGEIGP